jgi:hypothetical protein
LSSYLLCFLVPITTETQKKIRGRGVVRPWRALWQPTTIVMMLNTALTFPFCPPSFTMHGAVFVTQAKKCFKLKGKGNEPWYLQEIPTSSISCSEITWIGSLLHIELFSLFLINIVACDCCAIGFLGHGALACHTTGPEHSCVPRASIHCCKSTTTHYHHKQTNDRGAAIQGAQPGRGLCAKYQQERNDSVRTHCSDWLQARELVGG